MYTQHTHPTHYERKNQNRTVLPSPSRPPHLQKAQSAASLLYDDQKAFPGPLEAIPVARQPNEVKSEGNRTRFFPSWLLLEFLFGLLSVLLAIFVFFRALGARFPVIINSPESHQINEWDRISHIPRCKLGTSGLANGIPDAM